MKFQRKFTAAFLLTIILSSVICMAQEEIIYKEIDTTKLVMKVYNPEKFDTTVKYPCIIFFFGGGWKIGNINQFKQHAKYFSKRGMICFLADYRVEKRQGTSPFESLMDAKSAIRFLREHADEFHIDTARIVAAGGSAGGHLAAAAALIDGYNEKTDDLSISCIPHALALFNPVIDNGPAGYGYNRVGEAYKDFSPLHNINYGAPPTIMFFGTKDKLIPIETAKYYQTAMEKTDNRCELIFFEGEEHGFFNHRNFDNYKKTIIETDKFLQSLGYLQEDPVIEIK